MKGLKVENAQGIKKEYWSFWTEVERAVQKGRYMYSVIGEEAGTRKQDIIKITFDIEEALSLKDELKKEYNKILFEEK